MVCLSMMMMIAPNSLSRQKEGVQGEGEAEAGDQRKGGKTGTLTPVADAPTGLSRSGVLDARKRRKHGRWLGFHSTGGAEGTRD